MKLLRTCVFVALAALAVACGSDDEDGDNGGGTSASALGESCEAYYGEGGCCEEVAGDTQAAKDACAQGVDAIRNAISQGAKPSDYEAQCEAALDSAQTAGMCQ